MKRTAKTVLVWLLTAILLLGLLPGLTVADNWPSTIPDEDGCPSQRNHYKHHYNLVDCADADCTHGGWALYRCIYCQHEKKVTSNALGHDWGSWKTTKQPTCTAEGRKDRECKRCGYKQSTAIDALGHDWGEGVITQEPWCTDDGTETLTCKRCGITELLPVDALGHIWDSGVITKYPTLTEWGERTFTCQRDPSHTYTEPIPPKGDDSTPYYALVQTVTQTSPIKDAYPNDDGDWSKAEVVWYDWLLTNNGNRKLAIGKLIERNGELFDLNDLYGVITFLNPGESIVATEHRRAATEDMIADPSNSPYAGRITERYYAIGYDYEEYLNNGESPKGLTPVCHAGPDSLEWKIARPGDEQTGGDAWLTLVKKATLPADPNGFQLGETIGYGWEIEYQYQHSDEYPIFTGIYPLFTDVILYDDYALDGDAQAMAPSLGPNRPQIKNGRVEQEIPKVFGYKHLSGMTFFAKNRYIAHTVTQEDVDRGYFDNYMYMTYKNQDTGEEYLVYSNTVRVPVIADPALPMLLKAVTSTSQDPNYYVEGEDVTYAVKLVNNTQYVFTDLTVEDEGVVIGTVASLAPGESFVFAAPTHTVTAYDVTVGSVSNVATVTGKDPNGEAVYFTSNTVTVFTNANGGHSEPPISGASVSVFKEETSSPGMDGFYHVGETITYEITVTNTGSKTIDDGIVRDILEKENLGVIAQFTALAPGESRVFTYSHTVTDADAEHGKVVNFAIVQWSIGGKEGLPDKSNEVISYVGGMGIIDDDDGGFDPDPSGKASCKLILESEGGCEANYKVTHCADHAAIAKRLSGMEPADAVVQWRMAIEEQYQKLYSLSWGAASAAVLMEYDAFNVWMDNFTTMLNSVGNAASQEKLCVFLELYCTELCCAIHTAQDALPDSILGNYTRLADAGAFVHCATSLRDGIYKEGYGDTHATIYRATVAEALSARNGQAAARAFDNGADLWLQSMDTKMNAVYQNAALAKQTVAFARIAFDRYIEGRREAFGYLYPSAPETVSENTMKLYRMITMMLCETVEIEPPAPVVPILDEDPFSTPAPQKTPAPENPDEQTAAPGNPTAASENVPEATPALKKTSSNQWFKPWMIAVIAGMAGLIVMLAVTLIIVAARKKRN